LETRYLEFLQEKPRTWIHRNLIFDLEKLDQFFQCAGCHRRKPRAFCCRGYDVELTAHDLATVEKSLPAVRAEFPLLDRRLRQGPFWRWGDSFERLLRRLSNQDCIFLMPAGKGCFLHAWALKHGRDPLTVKPYICSLYPVVVIVIDDQVVITTFNPESKVLLDCGEDAASCIQPSGRDQDHALVKSAPILTRMFGRSVIQSLMKKAGRK
jgi:hypothetical protein